MISFTDLITQILYKKIPSALLYWGFKSKVVPQSGIEPLTRGFSVPCSTN